VIVLNFCDTFVISNFISEIFLLRSPMDVLLRPNYINLYVHLFHMPLQKHNCQKVYHIVTLFFFFGCIVFVSIAYSTTMLTIMHT
jgi:hypothetical protein